jgi:hypothetical protein
MTYKMYRALIAPLSAAALVLAANGTFGSPAAAPGARFASMHPTFRPVARSLHHRRRNDGGAFWPGVGDSFYGPSYDEPNMDVTPPAPPASSDIHTTYTYDVPWDAVHRFPPAVTPSARPYVPECTAQTVTVPRYDGAEQTANVNIMRCY